MTEIPEHLLKRSQAARRAAGGEAGGTEAATPAATTPATAASAAPAVATPKAEVAPVGPPPVKPDIPVVAAYKARKKIPVWAMVTLSILPLWGFLYVLALRPEPVKASGPLGAGVKVFTNCQSCHGASGEGIGTAYGFDKGSVLKTFPHIEDQLRWVHLGSDAYKAAGVDIAGDPKREGGPHITGATGGVMPAASKGLGLTDAEILAAVCHERYDIAGGDQTKPEFLQWCSPTSPIYEALKSGAATFDNVHTKFTGVMEIGSVPKAGTPAG